MFDVLYARCVRCKKRWNIAIGQRIPKTGYICPHCAFAAGGKQNLQNPDKRPPHKP